MMIGDSETHEKDGVLLDTEMENKEPYKRRLTLHNVCHRGFGTFTPVRYDLLGLVARGGDE